MTLELIKRYWQEACDLTTDLHPDQDFTTTELIVYLNDHLPPDSEKITKTKVNYLRDQGILKPAATGGEIRTSWRYSSRDVRRMLTVELLKTRADLSVQEIKGWLWSVEETQPVEGLTLQWHQPATQELPILTTPSSVAYTLLRNRVLGTLIMALSHSEAEAVPRHCLIAIRALNRSAEAMRPCKIPSWEDARELLETGLWHFAATDAHFKLYVYRDLERLCNSLPDVAQALPRHFWYGVTLQDSTNQFYEVVLGMPERDKQQPSNVALVKTLTLLIQRDTPLNLNDFPGLTTLLRAAFVNVLKIEKGTTLSALTEMIASASEAWDYCAILVPERSDDGVEKWLHIREHSSGFPLHLKDKRVEIGKFLSGWCYRYQQSVVVDPVIENDPRIAFYEEERPIAVAAMPAAFEEQQTVGVVYVAKYQRNDDRQLITSKELVAGLRAFAFICGDIITRDQIEVGTIQSIGRIFNHPLLSYSSFENLNDLVQRIVSKVQVGINPEKISHSWIYLLTLNIQIPSQDTITHWLCRQAAEMTSNFLSNRLFDPPLRDPLPIGQCEVEPDQIVFGILKAIDLPEERYKQKITQLHQEMEQIHIGRLSPGFYPWGVTFRFEDLRQQLLEKGSDELMHDIVKRTQGALIAAPYIRKGHEALSKSDLDHAVSEFEDALRILHYAPNSWYVYKHLAEARMLQGNEQAIEQAIEMCLEALKLNRNYTSARCLLADCLAYLGRFDEAFIEYERALAIDGNRMDFLIRFGLALASMTPSDYREALKYVKEREPELVRQRVYLKEPWQEAIDKFDRARKLGAMPYETIEGWREQRAKYHYLRGYAHLQAGLISKAVEDFVVGRKLAPDDFQLAQAYTYALRLRRRSRTENRSPDQ